MLYKYYLVTGMNNGVQIEPYVIAVSNASNDMTLTARGGNFFNPRYFDEITKEQYEKMKGKK